MRTDFTVGDTRFEFSGISSANIERLKTEIGKLHPDDKPLQYQIVNNAHICPLQTLPTGLLKGGIFDSDGKPISAAQIRRKNRGVILGSDPSTFSKVDAVTIPPAIFGGVIFSEYGHLILESLARLWCVAEVDDYPILFLSHQEKHIRSKLFMRLMFLLGIDPGRIRFSTKSEICESLIVPEPGLQLGIRTSSHYANFVRGRLSKSIKTQADSFADCRSAYLSRAGLSNVTRKPWSEDKLETLLAGQNQRAVRPERLDIRDQISLLNQCSRFGGFIGSQFHTLIFRFNPEPVDIAYLCSGAPNINFPQVDLLFAGRRLYGNVCDFAPVFEFGGRAPFRIKFKEAVDELRAIGFAIDGEHLPDESTEEIEVFLKQWFYGFFRYQVFGATQGGGYRRGFSEFEGRLRGLETRLLSSADKSIASPMYEAFNKVAGNIASLTPEQRQLGELALKRIVDALPDSP